MTLLRRSNLNAVIGPLAMPMKRLVVRPAVAHTAQQPTVKMGCF